MINRETVNRMSKVMRKGMQVEMLQDLFKGINHVRHVEKDTQIQLLIKVGTVLHFPELNSKTHRLSIMESRWRHDNKITILTMDLECDVIQTVKENVTIQHLRIGMIQTHPESSRKRGMIHLLRRAENGTILYWLQMIGES